MLRKHYLTRCFVLKHYLTRYFVRMATSTGVQTFVLNFYLWYISNTEAPTPLESTKECAMNNGLCHIGRSSQGMPSERVHLAKSVVIHSPSFSVSKSATERHNKFKEWCLSRYYWSTWEQLPIWQPMLVAWEPQLASLTIQNPFEKEHSDSILPLLALPGYLCLDSL
jgi:hypothetical protein